jgi:hypothetical protein
MTAAIRSTAPVRAVVSHGPGPTSIAVVYFPRPNYNKRRPLPEPS